MMLSRLESRFHPQLKALRRGRSAVTRGHARAQSFVAGREKYVAALFGVVATISTFYGLLAVADLLTFTLAVIVWRRPSWWALAIAAPVALSGIWAPNHWYPFWTAARIVSLAVVVQAFAPKARWIAVGMAAMLAVQALMLLTVITGDRPAGLTANPNILAESGLALFTAIPLLSWHPAVLGASMFASGMTLGIASARGALVAAGMVALMTKSRLLAGTIAVGGIVLLLNTAATGAWDRFGFADLSGSAGNRVILAGVPTGTGNPGRDNYLWQMASETARKEAGAAPKSWDIRTFSPTPEQIAAVDAAYPYRPPRFSVFGYGYGGFLPSTHTQEPHTLPVLALYDLGLLAFVIFGVIGWAIWKRLLPLTLVVPLGFVWLFTGDMWTFGGGHYLIALMVLVAVAGRKVKDERAPVPAP